MIKISHPVAGVIALLTVAIFWLLDGPGRLTFASRTSSTIARRRRARSGPRSTRVCDGMRNAAVPEG